MAQNNRQRILDAAVELFNRSGAAATSTNRREMQRLLMILVGAVVVIDAAVIGLYYAAGMKARPIRQQQMFGGIWIALTLIVVLTMMRKIRQARLGR
jgi:DMSO/TMAO reductase YedYZ heme-binding membrane subunit